MPSKEDNSRKCVAQDFEIKPTPENITLYIFGLSVIYIYIAFFSLVNLFLCLFTRDVLRFCLCAFFFVCVK